MISRNLLSANLSGSISRKELSINNYDRPINEATRVPHKPYTWKQNLSQSKSLLSQQNSDHGNLSTSFANDGETSTSTLMMNLRREVINQGSNTQNKEFSENVMHILDRSHVKYRIQIDDKYTIESTQAKKRIKTQQKLLKLMGPVGYSEYSSQKRKDQQNGQKGRAKSTVRGSDGRLAAGGSGVIFPIGKPQERNQLFH